MLTLLEIYQFINAFETGSEALKDYYDKCYETLKQLNKRSNLITFFILILFALYSFNSSIREGDVLGFKINQDVIKITSPLLISYFVLEWCLIARRRRELMKIMKHVGFKLFPINSVNEDLIFNHFGIHSRNIMPFSFLIEFVNVDFRSRLHAWLLLILLFALFIGVPFYIGTLLYVSFTQFKLTFIIGFCDVAGIYCLIQILLFYKNEISSIIKVQRADKKFIKEIISNQATQ